MTGYRARISVLVANYNGDAVIRRCLDSVLAQQVDAELELLVYDDASSDGSADVVESEYSDVILVRGQENVGFCRANNHLANNCSGDYLLLLNNDAWLEPGALAALLRASSGDCVLTLPQKDAETGELLDAGMGLDILATPYPLLPSELAMREVPTVMGACLWLPKPLWDRTGGFPDWFVSIGEDLYLCQYARILGAKVIVLEGPCYHHHVGHSFGGGKVVESGLSTTVARRRLSERNVLFVVFLFYPLPVLLLMLPCKLVVLLVEGVFVSLALRSWRAFADIYGHALSEFFRNFPRLRTSRRKIQARRAVTVRAYFKGFSAVPYKLRMLLRHGFPEVS